MNMMWRLYTVPGTDSPLCSSNALSGCTVVQGTYPGATTIVSCCCGPPGAWDKPQHEGGERGVWNQDIITVQSVIDGYANLALIDIIDLSIRK
jgi:hypothetical protein